MSKALSIGGRFIGAPYPAYIIAEIGINHNGDIEVAKKLIDAAVNAGCDAVKFQKRTPEICVPIEQRNIVRETPWGALTYLEYRHRLEFGQDEYEEIDRYCRQKAIPWFASCWDEPSVDFIEQFSPICYKIASASLTDIPLLIHINRMGRPMILSTGMSTMEEIRSAVSHLEIDRLIIVHCTSGYACNPEVLNLRMIQTLQQEFRCLVGYSGHEDGFPAAHVAISLGASYIERHITLDKGMWGSDHGLSLEPEGFQRLVHDIRNIEKALGDGVKRVYECERPLLTRLRRKNA